ncbi:MAG: GHKL domain-containing protein [Oscillospiraceae bacterium]|nr:GHKL domain-containing protein [Oscillospiraceae bacterium]
MVPDLSHTPGIYYAIAYWLGCTFYILQNPNRALWPRLLVLQPVFFAIIAAFMTATDGLPVIWFIPCVCFYVLMMLLDIKVCRGMSWLKTGYLCVRAFVLGELAAALEWQLFYYGLTALKLPLTMPVNLGFLVLTHTVVFGTMFLIERNDRAGYLRVITWREFAGAAALCLAVFVASNLSYVSQNTPFSSRFTAEIFIIRTLVDVVGVVMLHTYHVQLQELDTKLEMAHLQNMLQMQYNNYRISEDSIALVNQKYHDLKHQIALLRSQVSAGEKLGLLDQMEQEIRAYEAQNKTGNQVLDTMLTAKSLECQRENISLTCVADGQALSFMQPMDLSALFGNALDNAIESVKKLRDPEKRLIHVSVARQKNFLRIRVENCYEGELSFTEGVPASTKQDSRYHGFGLKSIQNTAAKYDGSMTIAARDGWFELRILFPLLPSREKEV